ncbi:MAG: 2-oxoacid:acceptor oxidoreductase family protein [Anaeromyxobacter sp.]
MATVADRPRPVLRPLFCKGCGRCIEACAHHAIRAGETVEPATGLVPVVFDPSMCNGCTLCIDACPEPYGLISEETADEIEAVRRQRRPAAPQPADLPAQRLPLPESRPLIVKGTYASAIGALLAGCRHVYGYPITPSTEGAELMAKLLPELGGTFVQAPSEVAAINMLYGTGGAGLPVMTFTSSPGFSLMLEGMSYLIGAELPAVVVNVMRGGPGLGNIAPEQSDVKLACRGLGHGSTHAVVLAPATPQEMLDFTILAFELAFRYRNPVVLLADGYLGQMTGKVTLPPAMVRPGLPGWAVSGDAAHRKNYISSIFLTETDIRGPQPEAPGQVRGHPGGGAAGGPLPLRGRRGAAGGLQHAGAQGQGRRGGAARGRDRGGPVPAADALAVPGEAAAAAAGPRAAHRGGGGQRRADRGRAAAGAQPRGRGAGHPHRARPAARGRAPVPGRDPDRGAGQPEVPGQRRRGGSRRRGGGARVTAFYDRFERHDHAAGLKAQSTHYCPGCGHGLVHKFLAEAVDELGIADRTVAISPVGCAVFLYYYLDVGNSQAAHGRAPAVALGHKLAHPESVVISYQGDGDLASIGLAEIVHAAALGVPISVIFVNNAIYGMTGGQLAPTSLMGQQTATSPAGRDRFMGQPLRMAEQIALMDAPIYVERVALYDAKQRVRAQKAIRKALQLQVENKGFSFVEVLAECPTHLKATPQEAERWVKEQMVPVYPLGVKKDVAPETWGEWRTPAFDAEQLLEAVGALEPAAPRACQGFPEKPFGKDIAIKLAGAGGDGAQTAAMLLVHAAINEGFDATHIPSYGPESRGGTSYADVRIAPEEVLNPAAPEPHVLVAFNAPSLSKFGPAVARGGVVVYDSAVVTEPPALDPSVRLVAAPLAEIAHGLGDRRLKSVVALGAVQRATQLFPAETFLGAVRQALSHKPSYIPLNEQAFEQGYARAEPVGSPGDFEWWR